MSVGIEKKWNAVAPQLFTADGTITGIITVADARGFRVKQNIVIIGTGLPQLRVQIKRFISATEFIVGPALAPQGQNTLTTRSDLSLYTVVLTSFVYAEEQDKVILKPDDISQATYQQEPANAVREVLVNEFGEIIDSVVGVDGKNRLAVDAAVTVTGITVDLDAFTKVPPDNVLSVGTEDGTPTGIKHVLEVDSNNDLHVINMGALVPKEFDDIDISYITVASQQVASVILYKVGGPTGTIVATLTLSYDGSANLTRVVRT